MGYLVRFQKSSIWIGLEGQLFYALGTTPVLFSALVLSKFKNPSIRFQFWIQFIVVSFFIFRATAFLIETFSMVFSFYFNRDFLPISFTHTLEIGICSIALGISGLYVFLESPYFRQEDKQAKELESKQLVSKKFVLREEDFEMIKSKIEAALSSSAVLCQADLTQQNFAEMLHIPKHQVSLVINNHYHCGFKELLNSRRIDLLISLKSGGKYENYSLYGLAQHCGYKAESTFIANFKKKTGKLPSEYFATS